MGTSSRSTAKPSTLGEQIAIRMAYKMCLEAAADDSEAKTAARVSPDSADIPKDDLATLKALFTTRHGFMVTSKRLLRDDMVKKTFRQFHSNPKSLKLYLPSQLRLSSSSPVVVGTSLTFIDGNVKAVELVAPEDFGDCVAFYKTLRAYFNTLSYVSISTPDWFHGTSGKTLLTNYWI